MSFDSFTLFLAEFSNIRHSLCGLSHASLSLRAWRKFLLVAPRPYSRDKQQLQVPQ